jgi:hypothetical protein
VPAAGGVANQINVQANSSCCPNATYNFSVSGQASLPNTNSSNGQFTVRFNENTSTDARMAVVTVSDNCGNTGYFVVAQAGTSGGGGGAGTIYWPYTHSQLPAETLSPGNYRLYFAVVNLGTGNATATPSTGTASTVFSCTTCNPTSITSTRFTGNTYESHTTRTLYESTRFAVNHLILTLHNTCNSGAPCSRPNTTVMLDFNIPAGATGWNTSNVLPQSPYIGWTFTNGTATTNNFPQWVAIQKLD